jgi:hypothetical protein
MFVACRFIQSFATPIRTRPVHPKIPAEAVIWYDDGKEYEGDASRQGRDGPCKIHTEVSVSNHLLGHSCRLASKGMLFLR